MYGIFDRLIKTFINKLLPFFDENWTILFKYSSITQKKQVRRGTYRESENLLRSIDIW